MRTFENFCLDQNIDNHLDRWSKRISDGVITLENFTDMLVHYLSEGETTEKQEFLKEGFSDWLGKTAGNFVNGLQNMGNVYQQTRANFQGQNQKPPVVNQIQAAKNTLQQIRQLAKSIGVDGKLGPVLGAIEQEYNKNSTNQFNNTGASFSGPVKNNSTINYNGATSNMVSVNDKGEERDIQSPKMSLHTGEIGGQKFVNTKPVTLSGGNSATGGNLGNSNAVKSTETPEQKKQKVIARAQQLAQARGGNSSPEQQKQDWLQAAGELYPGEQI